jgi:hypothetical protein
LTRLLLAGCLVGAAVAVAPEADTLQPPRSVAALERFIQAPDRDAAASAVGDVARAGVALPVLIERLRSGRTYAEAGTPTDTLRLTTSDGTTIETIIELPAGYTPDRPWPVRVQLHGGVGRPDDASPSRALLPNRLPGEAAIYLQPRGHRRAEWWHLNQLEHLSLLLDAVKRRYNVDENGVYVTGVSDGATGAYYYAMRLSTPFAAFLPLNGNLRVLGSPSTRAYGQVYAGNLRNKPLFIVNGGRDPLYPVSAVVPHIEMLRAAGVEVEFRPQPDAGHDTSWWPTERAAFEAFVHARPRQPHPEYLSWETERTDRVNRLHWLLITGLGRRPGDDAGLEDVNQFGVPGGEQRLFARVWPSGRVDARRSGNSFELRTRGVTTLTLLLSPDVVDVDRPVTVRVNGEVVFSGDVAEDPRTLLNWYVRDLDRTMLYTAALAIRVP